MFTVSVAVSRTNTMTESVNNNTNNANTIDDDDLIIKTLHELFINHSVALDAEVAPSALTLDVMKVLCTFDRERVREMQDALRTSSVFLDLHDDRLHDIEYVGVYVAFQPKEVVELFDDGVHKPRNVVFHFMPAIKEKFKKYTPHHFYEMKCGIPNLEKYNMYRLKSVALKQCIKDIDSKADTKGTKVHDADKVQAALVSEISRPDLLVCEAGSGVSAAEEEYRNMDDYGFSIFETIGSFSNWLKVTESNNEHTECVSGIARIPLNEFLNVKIDDIKEDYTLKVLVDEYFNNFADNPIINGEVEGAADKVNETFTFSHYDALSVNGHIGACFAQKVILEKKFTLFSEFLKWYLVSAGSITIEVGERPISSRAKVCRLPEEPWTTIKRVLPGTEYKHLTTVLSRGIFYASEWKDYPPANPYEGYKPGTTVIESDMVHTFTVPGLPEQPEQAE